jgi:hypothetical protein
MPAQPAPDLSSPPAPRLDPPPAVRARLPLLLVRPRRGLPRRLTPTCVQPPVASPCFPCKIYSYPPANPHPTIKVHHRVCPGDGGGRHGGRLPAQGPVNVETLLGCHVQHLRPAFHDCFRGDAGGVSSHSGSHHSLHGQERAACIDLVLRDEPISHNVPQHATAPPLALRRDVSTFANSACMVGTPCLDIAMRTQLFRQPLFPAQPTPTHPPLSTTHPPTPPPSASPSRGPSPPSPPPSCCCW